MAHKQPLQQRLDEIISRMRRVNKKIADEGQPPTQRELDELTSLGKEYSELVSEMTLASART